ncbi:MAG TPA: hypothetical protein VIG47_01715, partial [Gemmatimonadaceae bacterium]
MAATLRGSEDAVESTAELLERDGSITDVIRVEDVHRYYDLGETRVHALRGVSLTVERGGFVAIMGSSGS